MLLVRHRIGRLDRLTLSPVSRDVNFVSTSDLLALRASHRQRHRERDVVKWDWFYTGPDDETWPEVWLHYLVICGRYTLTVPMVIRIA
jgi:hypothetical protein